MADYEADGNGGMREVGTAPARPQTEQQAVETKVEAAPAEEAKPEAQADEAQPEGAEGAGAENDGEEAGAEGENGATEASEDVKAPADPAETHDGE